MQLRWKYFTYPYDLSDYIEKLNIKRENIQAIFLTNYDRYELFYWE